LTTLNDSQQRFSESPPVPMIPGAPEFTELQDIHQSDARLARRMLIVSATARDGAWTPKRFGVRKLTNTIAKGLPYPVGS